MFKLITELYYARFIYSTERRQIAFHSYCSLNVKQEQNAICTTCSE